jgi:RHS repeat-associated protein
VAWTRDGNGHTSRYAYDNEGRRTRVTRPDDTTASPSALGTAYYDNGAVRSQTDGRGKTTIYDYDHLDRPTAITDPTQRANRFGYDTTVNRWWSTDADGRRTTNSYDDANQLTSTTYSDGVTPNVSYAYDNAGHRTKMTDGTGTTCYAYDSLYRLRRSTAQADANCGGGETVTYGYNLRGNLTNIGYPGQGDVSRHFDDSGRLTSVTDFLGSAANTVSFGYDRSSNLICQSQTANGCDGKTTGAFSLFANRDPSNRTSLIMGNTNGALTVAWSYGRDPSGQLTSVASGGVGVNESYGYNPLDQIKTVNGGPVYDYDKAGNLTNLPGGNTLAYDDASQPTTMTRAGAVTHTYTYDFAGDAASGPSHTGNRIQDATPTGGTRYTYDQANRLTGVGPPSNPGSTARYTYNGDGLRQSKNVWTLPTNFTWDLVTGTTIRAGNTSASTYYVYGPGGLPVEQIRVSGTTKTATFLWHDQQGSTRLITNTAGATVGTYTYDPYGTITNHTDTTADTTGRTDLLYTGQYRDGESGFYYLRARYYDPTTGQFITRDPIAPLTRSPYAYVNGNPLNAIDPSGLVSWSDAGDFIKDHAGAIAVTAVVIGGIACAATVACAIAVAGAVGPELLLAGAGIGTLGAGFALLGAAPGEVCAGEELVAAEAAEGGLPELTIENSQFGQKVGQHAQDFGLNPADPEARSLVREYIEDIRANFDEVRQGPWNPKGGGGSDYLFFRQGTDVVVTKGDGTFVTILQGGDSNGWFQGSIPR